MKNTDEYVRIYRDGLMDNILPFWINHGIDRECGGFLLCLDRDGTVIDTDKSVWGTCRFTWLLATLYSEVEQRAEWLELARHGIDFIDEHCFDSDDRMFFHVMRDGKPIRKRRYVFSESFAAIAYAALARATGEDEYGRKARRVFENYLKYNRTPGLLPPKFTEHRKMKGIVVPMIGIATAQELRKNLQDESYTAYIDECLEEIRRDFMKPEFEAVMEAVGPNGEFIDHFDGRTLNPGHAIEGAWFVLNEAKHRNRDPELIKMGTTMLDWMWEIGWDKEHGGILYFRDVKGLPVQEYWHDMKFWWPQNEAVIATLMAYELTGDEKYARMHQMIHDFAFKYFPDPEYGEWYGYLHRDGSVSSRLKGGLWKGPFHVARMHLMAWQILQRIQNPSEEKSTGL